MSQSETRRILDARLASGEIGMEEYERIRTTLEADGGKTVNDPPRPLPESEAGASAAQKRFILRRVWRGELSLPATYWGWGVLGGLVVVLPLSAVMAYAEKPAGAAVTLVLLLAWSIFIAVAVFRSAAAYKKRYPRRRAWGYIAQGMVVLGLLGSLGDLVQALPGNESDADLDAAVAQANKAGPHMVGDNVRFDRTSREGRVFVYSFTIVGLSHVPPPEVVAQARAKTVGTVCGRPDLRRLLLSLDKVTYRYANDAGLTLMSYDVARVDCEQQPRQG